MEKVKFTEREKEVMELIVEGLNNYHISDRLSVSYLTVKVYVSEIYKKLDVQNRIQAVVKYLMNNARISVK